MPAFPQKLTWGYSELLPKSAPETAQNSRLMSKSGPFSCRTIQNSRVAAKAGRPPPKPSRTPGPRRMPRNRKSARQTRPAPQGDTGLTQAVCNREIKHSIPPSSRGRPPSSETKPTGSRERPCPKSAGGEAARRFRQRSARSPRRSYSAISMRGWGAAARSPTVTPST